LLVVLVPTVCVLWFMTEAMENRRAVVCRSLVDADLTVAQERLETYWRDQVAALEGIFARADSESTFFQRCVEGKLADSVVCYDRGGRPVYPASARRPGTSEVETHVDWSRMERLEFEQNQFDAAAAAYEEIVAAHGNPTGDAFDANLAARAVLGQARCLAKAGQKARAVKQLTEILGQEAYRRAVDPNGRLMVAAAELRALELIEDLTDARFRSVAERLSKRLKDYADPALAAPQRIFLMKQFQSLIGERLRHSKEQATPSNGPHASLTEFVKFSTLQAEELAAEFSEANPVPSKETAVRLTQSSGVWQLAASNKQVVALFRTESLIARSQEAIAARGLRSGAQVTPVPPGTPLASVAESPTAEAGGYLPGWRLEYSPREGDSEPIADAKITAYFWTGILVIATMSIFAAVLAHAFRRQLRLTRLKNDLVATVSHELKTPLSSIRLLVDTLLDAPEFDQRKVREYLGLVAKENMRLSRLIDNFLAFSRMERNKHAFEFEEIQVADVIDGAVEVARERHDRPDFRLQVEVAADLPPIEADVDALVTVLLNLFDNAYKYSRGKAPIILRAYAKHGNVCLEVEDNGVGLSKAAARKVFKRFYQVDRSVSCETGGVGLGLSIVQFIVTAHDGTVCVRSRPSHGSTFTVSIPAQSVGRKIEKDLSP
jgi:signal transduction histidine kinase